MTENTAEHKPCIMESRTDHPCPFPATEALPHKLPEGNPLCAYHAATEPLVDESNEFGVCLGLVEAYLDDARHYAGAASLVEVLERAQADFAERQAVAEKVLKDLRAAERRLMRGRPR